MIRLALAVGLALVHLTAGRLRVLDAEPRSGWLSFCGGISVAYVFAHLLPEVAAGQRAVAEVGLTGGLLTDGHVWLIALVGLVGFYGLERAVQTSRDENQADGGPDRTEPGVFWVDTACYAVYYGVIGYLLGSGEERGGTELALYWVAMALHFVVNDAALRRNHQERYHRVGRWVLAGASVGGAGLGIGTEVPEAALAGVVAFLAGGIVLTVLKEELPEERQSRFWPFAAGAAGYAALLVAVA